MNWRPHTEPPAKLPIVALVAVRDPDDGEYYLAGLFMQTEHRPGVWVHEEDDFPLASPEFWWIPESELLMPFVVGRMA